MTAQLVCPDCGNDDPDTIRYVETIENHRQIVGFGGAGVLHVAAAYETGEGYDEGRDPHFECDCTHRWPVPDAIATNIEWDL